MTTRYWPILLGIAALMAVGLVACGEDDTEGEQPRKLTLEDTIQQIQRASFDAGVDLALGTDEKVAGHAANSSAADTTPVSQSPTEPERRPADARAPRVTPLAMLKDASAKLTNSTYKLVYRIGGSDPDTGALDGKLTLVSKDRKQAFGISGKLGGDMGTFLVINNGQDAFLCIEGQGDSACLKTHRTAEAPIPLPSVMNIDDLLKRVANNPNLQVREVGGQNIAGRESRCFEVDANEGRGLVCVAEDEGVVSLINGRFGNSEFEMRLDEYNPQPADQEFEPPYTVTELP